MLEDHQLLYEKACDEQATKVSNREDLTETVLKITRLQQPTPDYASAFADCHARLRIEALLQKPGATMPPIFLYAASAAVLGLFLMLVDPLHHLFEWMH